jgi:DNA-binding cell septation regulator SpoVG
MPNDKKPEKTPNTASTRPQKGGDPEKAAWLTAFYIENHLDPFAYPGQVASPEQIRFMVCLDEDERYYPCSDEMFEAIVNRDRSDHIQAGYKRVLDKVLALINDKIEDPKERRYLETLVRIKYHHETRDEMMIPSRLEKRLTQIFINRTQIEDPNISEKTIRNKQAARVLESAAFQKALNHWDVVDAQNQPRTLAEVKAMTEQLELKRLLTMTGESAMWLSSPPRSYTKEDFLDIFNRPITGSGAADFFQLFGAKCQEGICHTSAKRFLWGSG